MHTGYYHHYAWLPEFTHNNCDEHEKSGLMCTKYTSLSHGAHSFTVKCIKVL